MNACLRRNSGMDLLRPRAAACVAALLVLAACAAPAPRGGPAQDSQPAPAQHGAATDASYDWRGLVLAPFGTLLKESPIPLHEVVLFDDETHGTAEADGKDCYGIDGAPPRFVGRQPDQYLLCFDHDRLTRVDAAVRVTRRGGCAGLRPGLRPVARTVGAAAASGDHLRRPRRSHHLQRAVERRAGRADGVPLDDALRGGRRRGGTGRAGRGSA